MPRAGIVTLAGKPNAGKSTLLNRLIGQRLSITSPKPQSTRDRVVGILTRGQLDDPADSSSALTADRAIDQAVEPSQLILFDTPGLIEPRDDLQRSMRTAALMALADADVIVYLADATAGTPPSLELAAGLNTRLRAPVILALNKIDTVPAHRRAAFDPSPPPDSDFATAADPDPSREPSIPTSVERASNAGPATGSGYAGSFLISAVTGEGVEAMLDAVTALLPESPFLYPADDVSTQSVRFFVTELIRETAFEQLDQELPYSLAAQVEEFREDRSPVYIRAFIYVERDSQQGILVGHKGSRIREIGRAARIKIEQLIDAPVYLDLRVKVLPNWRRDPDALRRFGYLAPPAHRG
jgi:GTP-binding protein Era